MYNGKQVNICVPTLNNYNGLENMIKSIENGSIKPDNYYIIDNGCKLHSEYLSSMCKIHTFGRNLGVASSWNWFIDNVPEYRIILNDDLLFFPNTLENFLEIISDLFITVTTGTTQLNAFSFFSIPDHTVRIIGKFDENFYPAYFEDNDYARRMVLVSLPSVTARVDIMHAGSQTMKNYSNAELARHHDNFRRNQEYYISKWGGLPGKETRA